MSFFYSEKDKSKKSPLKLIMLGGTETVTKNLTIYEYRDEIIIVDCGVGMPDSEMPGVDLVIPDFSYLLQNSHKVKALFVTHGHEDHIGAIPYLLQQLNVPVYANKLVQGFIQEKLKEKNFKNLADSVRFNLITPEMPEVQVASFKVSAFRINHSVPSSMGFAIRTPEGLILHMADYRIDWTPVMDEPIDLGRIAAYGNEGVLCLLSDCLGVTTEGYSKSESTLNDTFFDLFEDAGQRQVFVTTISSNISRMYQIITSAIRHGRRVVLSGRSIEQNVGVARRLGFLPFDEGVFVPEQDASGYPQGDLVYIIAGCYGQQGSSLDRLSRIEHQALRLEKDALVIFSADPNPPGVDIDVEKVMSNLTIAGAEVIYGKIQQNLHVSGHGARGDLMTIAAVVKPKYFVPIGGTITKMRVYTNMLEDLRVSRDRIFECREGESIEFLGGSARKGQALEVKPVFIDAKRTDEISPVVIRDRETLSTEGVFVVVIPTSKGGDIYSDKLEIVTRGFVYVKGSQELMDKSRKFIIKDTGKNLSKSKDWNTLKRRLENDIEKFLYQETARRPLVIVHSLVV